MRELRLSSRVEMRLWHRGIRRIMFSFAFEGECAWTTEPSFCASRDPNADRACAWTGGRYFSLAPLTGENADRACARTGDGCFSLAPHNGENADRPCAWTGDGCFSLAPHSGGKADRAYAWTGESLVHQTAAGENPFAAVNPSPRSTNRTGERQTPQVRLNQTNHQVKRRRKTMNEHRLTLHARARILQRVFQGAKPSHVAGLETGSDHDGACLSGGNARCESHAFGAKSGESIGFPSSVHLPGKNPASRSTARSGGRHMLPLIREHRRNQARRRITAMLELHLTKHAVTRIRQLGVRKSDHIFLYHAGSPVAGDAIILSDEDVFREIASNPRNTRRIEHLRGFMLVVKGGSIISLHHSGWKPSRSTGQVSTLWVEGSGITPRHPNREQTQASDSQEANETPSDEEKKSMREHRPTRNNPERMPQRGFSRAKPSHVYNWETRTNRKCAKLCGWDAECESCAFGKASGKSHGCPTPIPYLKKMSASRSGIRTGGRQVPPVLRKQKRNQEKRRSTAMFDLRLTKHVMDRMQQRGFQKSDLVFLYYAGSHVADDAIFLSDKDAAREIALNPENVQQIERLRGTVLVVVDGTIITLYHSKWKPSRGSGLESTRRDRGKPCRRPRRR